MRSYSKNRERNGAKARKARALPILVRRSPSDARRGLLQLGHLVFPCALGRGSTSAIKREGDGATPIGRMPILGAWFRPGGTVSNAQASALGPLRITADIGWCDAPDDRNYNRPVRLPYAGGHEMMWRTDRLYDFCVVLDWNASERKRGRGSAIFFHVARPGLAPTEGCIAVPPAVMRLLVQHLRRGQAILVER